MSFRLDGEASLDAATGGGAKYSIRRSSGWKDIGGVCFTIWAVKDDLVDAAISEEFCNAFVCASCIPIGFVGVLTVAFADGTTPTPAI